MEVALPKAKLCAIGRRSARRRRAETTRHTAEEKGRLPSKGLPAGRHGRADPSRPWTVTWTHARFFFCLCSNRLWRHRYWSYQINGGKGSAEAACDFWGQWDEGTPRWWRHAGGATERRRRRDATRGWRVALVRRNKLNSSGLSWREQTNYRVGGKSCAFIHKPRDVIAMQSCRRIALV